MSLGLRFGQQWHAGLIVVVSLASGIAAAQQKPDAGTILQTVPPAREPNRPAGAGRVLPAPPPSMHAPANVQVTIRSVQFKGNTLFADADLQKAVAEYLNKSLNADGLDDLLRSVTSVYRSAGYFLAQAYFPKQDLTAGKLEVYLLEGRLGKVTIERDSSARLREFVARGYLSSIKEGAVATESEIEQPLLLLQDLPGTTVKSSIGPGAKPGEADLKVQLGDDGRRIGGIGEVQNFGNKYAGAIQAGAQVFLMNPTGLGDILTLRGMLSENSLTQLAGVTYALPVGPWGTKAGISYSDLRYKLGGSLSSSQASGDAQLFTLLLIHPFVRSRNFNIYGQINVDRKYLEDRIGNISSIADRKIDDVRVGLFGDSRDFLLGGGINSFSAIVTSGKLSIKPSPAGPDALASDQTLGSGAFTNGNFQKFNAEFRRVQQVVENLALVTSFSLQQANKNLASVEKVSIGGPQSVRAYAVGEALGDQALTLTAEMRYKVPQWKAWTGDVQVVGFFDGARLYRYRNQPAIDTGANGLQLPNIRNLYGAGFGLRVGAENNFALVADLAWRVGNEASQSDRDRYPRGWIHLIKYF